MTDLFSPLDVSSLHLRNRFAMAPMTRMKSPGGVPNEENAEYYRQRAAGGTGLLITEGTYIRGPAAGPSPDVPRIYGAENAAGWKAIVDGVHAEGAAIIPQLWHLGAARGDAPDFEPDQPTVSPSGVDGHGKTVGRELTTADLEAAVASFAESAAYAKQIGFDGVELHGAHGYFLDQFLWDRTNLREDSYGGSISHRAAFPSEVVAAVRAAVGPDFAIVYRYSQWKGGDYEAVIASDPQELAQILRPLADAGVDVFHVSTRRHWSPAFDGDTMSLAGWTKKVTGKQVITVGSVGVDTVFRGGPDEVLASSRDRLAILEAQFANGEFDIVALGRALLADPAWVDKLRTGRLDDVVPFEVKAA